MKITELLDKRSIKIGLDATEKEDALKELVDVLAAVKDIGDKKSILRALIERENLGSTGIGQGIAIPHGKTDRVQALVAVLAISQKGVNFEALDGEPAQSLVARDAVLDVDDEIARVEILQRGEKRGRFALGRRAVPQALREELLLGDDRQPAFSRSASASRGQFCRLHPSVCYCCGELSAATGELLISLETG